MHQIYNQKSPLKLIEQASVGHLASRRLNYIQTQITNLYFKNLIQHFNSNIYVTSTVKLI